MNLISAFVHTHPLLHTLCSPLTDDDETTVFPVFQSMILKP